MFLFLSQKNLVQTHWHTPNDTAFLGPKSPFSPRTSSSRGTCTAQSNQSVKQPFEIEAARDRPFFLNSHAQIPDER